MLLSSSFQLVYKVKLDFVMEKLALVSLRDHDHEVRMKLVEEAKTNLMKIMVLSQHHASVLY